LSDELKTIETKAYGGVRNLPTVEEVKAAEAAPMVMRGAKFNSVEKNNNWEAVNLVEVKGRWIATAECRGVGAQVQVPRHIVKVAETDPAHARFLLKDIARKLRKKLNRNLMRVGKRPLPAVPERDPDEGE
jgi:hypothetical protein